MTLDELRRTAQARGIATTFTDAGGRFHEVSEATLEAVLEAMGPAPDRRDWPPVVGARQGWPPPWRPPAGDPATLELASGEERPLPDELPGDLPVGRHRVTGRTGATTLVVAPRRSPLPALLGRGGPAVRRPLAGQLGHRRPGRPGRAAGLHGTPGRRVRPAQPVARC